MKQALLLADIQNDFLPGGSLAVPDGDQVLGVVEKLLQPGNLYDLIVVIQDWHPEGHGSFASAHPGADPFQTGELAGLEQVFWPDHCVQQSAGARLDEKIRDTVTSLAKQGQKTLVVKKGQDPEVDSYSGFFDNARRRDTGLSRALLAHGIEKVDIVGLAFDYCVKATALDSASLGFRTRILLDGTRAIDPSQSSHHIEELEKAGVQCVGRII
jgi:nicotinamidase/pyrazinamidase